MSLLCGENVSKRISEGRPGERQGKKGQQGKKGRKERIRQQKEEAACYGKGEHKHVFAYAVETACDEHGWVLGYSVHPGNEHDSRTFQTIYEKVKSFEPEMIVADAGYKTPAIARQLLKDRIEPLFPYKRPMTKEGFFKKYEYVYDEYYDCYIVQKIRF